MAKAKKSKAKKSSSRKAKAKKSKATRRPAKAARAAKAKKKTNRKSASRKAPARKAAAQKAPAKKTAARKPKQTVGEGDYAASRKFLKDQAGFVKRNESQIPAMGKEAEKALEGPEGNELRAAEDDARARSRE